jgi:hypothetical protein
LGAAWRCQPCKERVSLWSRPIPISATKLYPSAPVLPSAKIKFTRSFISQTGQYYVTDIEDLLAERGIDVSFQPIAEWADPG